LAQPDAASFLDTTRKFRFFLERRLQDGLLRAAGRDGVAENVGTFFPALMGPDSGRPYIALCKSPACPHGGLDLGATISTWSHC